MIYFCADEERELSAPDPIAGRQEFIREPGIECRLEERSIGFR
jgi:hypothetical protein